MIKINIIDELEELKFKKYLSIDDLIKIVDIEVLNQVFEGSWYIVDYDEANEYILANENDIARIKVCLDGVDFSDNYYYIDVYNNLYNFTSNDIKIMIDDLIVYYRNVGE